YGTRVYVFEFKLDGSVEEALGQIKEKGYYRRYVVEGKEVWLVGVNFSSATRQVQEWKAERML
ncbi:MAG: PD-(D/E)XK nuclease domain-containing protein, partial [Bernardetiaceae bacterium]|nr:PD-(D/E)XK nuclease domain-containing protein [Bernardetiaceae bacterium]